MEHAKISVRPIECSEWPLYRQMRLRALQDAPDAFGSTYEAEAARADAVWSTRIAAAVASGQDRALFAVDGDAVCGLVWCKLSATEAGRADLFQMWIDPVSRGRGAGRALLDAAVAWASHAGVRRIRLGVTAADTSAMRLYQGRGFRPFGALEPLREGSRLMAQPMELEVDAGGPTA